MQKNIHHLIFTRNSPSILNATALYWGDDEFTEIDFGCDRLRELAEEQAAVLAHAG